MSGGEKDRRHPSLTPTAMRTTALGIGLLVMHVLTVGPLSAQSRHDIVRGRVTADSGRGVAGADVIVTRVADRSNKTTRTDSVGVFVIDWPDGTGEYVVSVTAPGYRSFATRLIRSGNDSVLVADVQLSRTTQRLAAVVTQAQRPIPDRDPSAFNAGANESSTIPINAARRLPPDQAGDLAAIASMLPGVTPTSGGISVLGLAPDQNQITLNGMAFSGTDIPRDALTRLRVQVSSYDPANGWFSGAQTAVDLALGSQFTTRTFRVSGDAPALQYTDPISARSGQQFSNANVSVGGAGQLVDDHWAYNFGLQGGRKTTDVASLLNADADLLQHAGLSPDSAARFLTLLRQDGIPTSLAGVPRSSIDDNISFLGRVDHAPYDWTKGGYNRFTYGLLAYGKVDRTQAQGFTPLTLPAHAGTASQSIGSLDALTTFLFGRDYLADLRTGLTMARTVSDPYLSLPDGRALVVSTFPDQTQDASTLQFGGNGAMSSNVRSWRWETKGELQLYPPGRATHRVKLSADARYDAFAQDVFSNRLGTFSYSSLGDLAANQPASFTRTLDAPTRRGGEWNAFGALGDLWRVSQHLQVIYGARVDGNAFTSAPALNPALLQALGVRTDHAPNGVGVSPRLGFTWQNNGRTIRGGVGEFRNLLDASLLASPSVSTGLPGSLTRLTCIGSAVPIPDWANFASNPSTIPTQCAPGSTVYVDASPNVQAVDSHFRPQQSWRVNLGGSSSAFRNVYSIEGLLSLNRDQPGIYDRNFSGIPRFVTSDEGRPVYVSASSIVPTSGAVAPNDARIAPAFGRVVSSISDLSSVSEQLVMTLRPNLPTRLRPYLGDPTVAYTLTDIRARQRGFDGATFGDPTTTDWVRGDLDSRHQIVGQLVFRAMGDGRALLFVYGRLLSGLPYTPLVGSDVNGDGLANDRAFIFNPAAVSDPSLAAGMRSLLATATPSVRHCLRSQVGEPAARNSCEGPWTAALNASLRLSGEQLLHTPRMDVTVNFANPLGGLDQLLHGPNNLRGWGTPALPDRTLYTVRGFDPSTNRFLYDVNQRFGSTRPSSNTLRAPFRLTLDVSFDIARSIPEQQLERWLRPGRNGRPGDRPTAADLFKRFQRTVPDPYAELLAQSDSLLVSDTQVVALQQAQNRYRAHVDSLWRELSAYVASLGDRYDLDVASGRVDATTDAVWEFSRLDVQEQLQRILAPAQTTQLGGWTGLLFRAHDHLHIRLPN